MLSLSKIFRAGSLAVLKPLFMGVSLVVLLAGCSGEDSKKEKSASQTAARVNKEEITVHQINEVLQQQRALKPEMVASASMEVLQRLVEQELMVQKAKEQKIDRDPRVVQKIEASRREIIARAYLEKIGSGAPKPTPEEVSKYYEGNPNLFRDRKLYAFQEINIEATPEQIPGLRDKLGAAKDVNAFIAAIKAEGYKFGGRQTTLAAEQLPLANLEKISKMSSGQALFNVNAGGVQVAVLAGYRSQPLDEARARPAIEQFLLNERKRKLVDDDMQALKSAAKIEFVGDYAKGQPKSLEEKLSVTPSSSPLVSAPASAGSDYMPPKPEPIASAPADVAPAESFTASSPTDQALNKGLKGFK
jgi:EpsD family peptidyl-prolyl cis-trans isomerase